MTLNKAIAWALLIIAVLAAVKFLILDAFMPKVILDKELEPIAGPMNREGSGGYLINIAVLERLVDMFCKLVPSILAILAFIWRGKRARKRNKNDNQNA